ncbi:hypothetical protein [uncultured Prochlorococcus sp.]|uniref:hypothetical protein n=1 Tax=uncultured Prochlorococcus sp. TaxID=159733 RepID=UPI00258C689B|nr:hypothetical protein [uncultured Prochlorococcus sp.]
MHHIIDDTEMATIRRSGSGWQVLIRKKNYVGPRSRTFLSRDLAQSWANEVEERTKKVLNDIPVTLCLMVGLDKTLQLLGSQRSAFCLNFIYI